MDSEQQSDILGAVTGAASQMLGAQDNSKDEDELPEQGWLMHIIQDIFYSPMNLCLFAIIIFLIYKIVRDRTEVPVVSSQNTGEQELPKLRRDFTIGELRDFDGTQPDGRVLVAVNGNVYDVTKGRRFYGPGGPYASFAGRDASRNLATFSVTPNDKDEYDDLSDLSPMEMESVIEWELQFKEKYEYVGKLLRENEPANNYDDEEEEDVEAEDEIEECNKNGKTNEINESESVRKRRNVVATEESKLTSTGSDNTLKINTDTKNKFTNDIENIESNATEC